MDPETVTRLEALLAEVHTGRPQARDEASRIVVNYMQQRIGALLRGSFRGLDGRHDIDSLVNEAWRTRLSNHLGPQGEFPRQALGLLRLVSESIRFTLLDRINQLRRVDRHRVGPEALSELGTSTYDPARLEELAELHSRAQGLPEGLRDVFHLRQYCDFPFAQIGEQLGISEATAHRRWREAVGHLSDGLAE
jgi:hypothetical protein